MNSILNLTTARLRRTLLVIALVICPLLVSGTANAQIVTATLTNNGSNNFNITQGQTFTLTLQITTNFISSGITYFFLSNNTGGIFRVVARDTTTFANPGCTTCEPGPPGFGSPYVDETTDDACAFMPSAAGVCNADAHPDPGLLDANGSDFDLGGTNNGAATDPAGTYTIAILTFNTLNAPIGTYQIFIDRGVVTDRTSGFVDRGFTAMATINVIPEPATVGLAAMGGAMLLLVAWRKQRSRA